jgi:hypothetical protein
VNEITAELDLVNNYALKSPKSSVPVFVLWKKGACIRPAIWILMKVPIESTKMRDGFQ